jgi:hypothetical protein
MGDRSKRRQISSTVELKTRFHQLRLPSAHLKMLDYLGLKAGIVASSLLFISRILIAACSMA